MNSHGITYKENGKAGEPVVFLHGIGGSAESFEHQLSGLSDFHCYAWNMPGYASSKVTTWPPSFSSLSDALHDFIETVLSNTRYVDNEVVDHAKSKDAAATSRGHNTVHLVGQSIGGMLAIEHAVRYPQQIASLSLIATTPSFGGRDESFKDAFIKARLAPLEAGKSMAEVAALSAPHLVGPIATKQTIHEIKTILANVSEETWRGILTCLVSFNRRDALASIQQACCVIAGSDDQNAPVRTMQKMSDVLHHSQFHVVEGAGHMVNQEAPDRVNDLLRHFLKQQPL